MWERLQRETRPIVLYGMGDGAEKILRVFASYGISVAAVFASDEFVRGHSFAGYRVQKLSEVIAEYGDDIVIAIAFASQRPEVLQKMYTLDVQYDVVAPDVPVIGQGLFDHAYVQAHKEQLMRVEALLADDWSHRVFQNSIAYRLSGRLQYLRDCESSKDEVFQNILRPCASEHFVDLGAYNGDTIRELLQYTGGQYASITALEPDRRNYKKLRKYVDSSLDGNAATYHAGAWETDDTLCFAAKAGRNSTMSGNGTETTMRAVDSVLDGAPCTLLKLDVEGAERQALLGAKQTMQTHRPKINLALYHRTEDLFELPLLLHKLCADYRFYLRHHPYVPAWDTNLYAVPQQKNP